MHPSLQATELLAADERAALIEREVLAPSSIRNAEGTEWTFLIPNLVLYFQIAGVPHATLDTIREFVQSTLLPRLSPLVLRQWLALYALLRFRLAGPVDPALAHHLQVLEDHHWVLFDGALELFRIHEDREEAADHKKKKKKMDKEEKKRFVPYTRRHLRVEKWKAIKQEEKEFYERKEQEETLRWYTEPTAHFELSECVTSLYAELHPGAAICDASLPLVSDFETVYLCDEEAVKRSDVLHTFAKCKLLRNALRTFGRVVAKKLLCNKPLRLFMLKVFLCSLLGNYADDEVHVRLPFAVRCVFYRMWKEANAPSSSSSSAFGEAYLRLLLCSCDKMFVAAVQRYMCYRIDHNPYLSQGMSKVFSVADLKKYTAQSFDDLRVLLRDRKRLELFLFEPGSAAFSVDESVAFMHDIQKAIASDCHTKVLTLCHRRNRGQFMNLLLSVENDGRSGAASLKDDDGDEEDEEEEEEEQADSDREEKEEEEAAAAADDEQGPSTMEEEVDGAAFRPEDSFQLEQLKLMWELICAIDPHHACPESFMFDWMPRFGCGEDSTRALKIVWYRYTIGEECKKELLELSTAFPIGFSYAQNFAFLWRRHHGYRFVPLPYHYRRYQLEALCRLHGIDPTQPYYLPSYTSCAWVCECCYRLYNFFVDFQKDSYGKNLGMINSSVYVDMETFETHPKCTESHRFLDGVKSCEEGFLTPRSLIGCALVLGRNTYFICPNCGNMAVLNIHLSIATHKGYTCAFCTQAMIVNDPELTWIAEVSRQVIEAKDMTASALRNLTAREKQRNQKKKKPRTTQEQESENLEQKAKGTTKEKTAKTTQGNCDVCLHTRLRGIKTHLLNGIEVKLCAHHRIKYLRERIGHCPTKKVMDPSCPGATDPALCRCTSWKQTCTGTWTWTHASLVEYIKVLDESAKQLGDIDSLQDKIGSADRKRFKHDRSNNNRKQK